MAEFSNLRGEIHDWSFQSDEKLIRGLENYLHNLLSNVDKIDQLTESIDYEANSVGIELKGAFNSFNNLSNSKFIENTMLQIDEYTQNNTEVNKPQITQLNDNRLARYVQAMKTCLDIFGISAVDDDESNLNRSNTNIMINPAGDKLPCIIGSKVFETDDFLGLVDKTEDVLQYIAKINEEKNSQNINKNTNNNKDLNKSGITQVPAQVSNSNSSNIILNNNILSPNVNNMSSNQGQLTPNKVMANLSQNNILPSNEINRDIRPSPINILPPSQFNLPINPGKTNILPPPSLLLPPPKSGAITAPPPLDLLLAANKPQAYKQKEAENDNKQETKAIITIKQENVDKQESRPIFKNELTLGQELKSLLARKNNSNSPIRNNPTQILENQNKTIVPPKNMNVSSQNISRNIKNPINTKHFDDLFADDDDNIDIGSSNLFTNTNERRQKFTKLLSQENNVIPQALNNYNTDLSKNKNNNNSLYESNSALKPLKTQTSLTEQKLEKPLPLPSKLPKLFEDSDEDEEKQINRQKELNKKYKSNNNESMLKSNNNINASQIKKSARISDLFKDDEEDKIDNVKNAPQLQLKPQIDLFAQDNINNKPESKDIIVNEDRRNIAFNLGKKQKNIFDGDNSSDNHDDDDDDNDNNNNNNNNNKNNNNNNNKLAYTNNQQTEEKIVREEKILSEEKIVKIEKKNTDDVITPDKKLNITVDDKKEKVYSRVSELKNQFENRISLYESQLSDSFKEKKSKVSERISLMQKTLNIPMEAFGQYDIPPNIIKSHRFDEDTGKKSESILVVEDDNLTFTNSQFLNRGISNTFSVDGQSEPKSSARDNREIQPPSIDLQPQNPPKLEIENDNNIPKVEINNKIEENPMNLLNNLNDLDTKKSFKNIFDDEEDYNNTSKFQKKDNKANNTRMKGLFDDDE